MAQIHFILISIYNLKFKTSKTYLLFIVYFLITLIIIPILMTIITETKNNDKNNGLKNCGKIQFFQMNFFNPKQYFHFSKMNPTKVVLKSKS